MKAEIICVGTELLVGEIVNTNVKYIAEKLTDTGIDLCYQTTVGDNYKRLKECLNIALNRVDIIITTGGLGPTADDITKEVIADFFDEELIIIDDYYDAIVKKYEVKGFEVALGAKKEASVLKNSTIIKNKKGLAPGFFYEKDRKKIFVLPGPPKELEWMVDNELIPLLCKFSNEILLIKTLEINNVPEGTIDDKLKKYFEMINPTIAPYAKENSVHIRVAMKGEKNKIQYLENEINQIISEIKNIFENAIEINKKY